MKNVVIGTAGHVDHGKTLLVKALTGMDTDRLAEEKKRGITIELGFAHIRFPDGLSAGIVDVPGHEKFIRNMLSGAGGIDLAMLVVAADEGVMPQTVEHLGILSLLGIRDGIVVITKTDMVDEEWLPLVRSEIGDHVRGTFLEGKPVAAVSAVTGAGIPELRELLHRCICGAAEKETRVPFRLPIDRVFSVDGFGTVVTGTLIEGTLSVGDEAAVYPQGRTTRIRNLQVHGESVPAAYAGQRTAVNLAGLHKSGLDRGDILAAPWSVHVTQQLAASVSLLPEAKRELKSGSRLHLYHGAKTLLCQVRLLDCGFLRANEKGYAVLRLEEPLACKAGDRFVLRFFSPLETIGGGVILETAVTNRRHGDQAYSKTLSILEKGRLRERLLREAAQAFERRETWDEMAKRLTAVPEAVEEERISMVSAGELISWADSRYITRAQLDVLGEEARRLLAAYHGANPLREGMRRDELRQKLLGASDAAFDELLEALADKNFFRLSGRFAALRDFSPNFTPAHLRVMERLRAIYAGAGLAPPDTSQVAAGFISERAVYTQALDALITREELVLLTPQIILSRPAYDGAAETMRAHFCRKPELTLGELRDELGTSRKYALALFEHWDRLKITKKSGDVRTLSAPQAELNKTE